MGKDDARYSQLAAAWGVDVEDASIQLLREFDRQLALLQGQTERLEGHGPASRLSCFRSVRHI